MFNLFKILSSLITFIQDKNENDVVGYLFAFLLLFTSIVQSICLQHYFHRMFIVGARIRTSLMGLIYKKSLRLSTQVTI